MTSYTYNRGVWTEGINLPKFNDGEQTAEYLERVGFSPSGHRFGSDLNAQILLYEGTAAGRSDFFAVVAPTGNGWYDVHLPDLPSAMQFIKDYGAAFSAQELQTQIEVLNERFAKFFRAEHGHDVDMSCKLCDPVGAQEAQALDARLRGER